MPRSRYQDRKHRELIEKGRTLWWGQRVRWERKAAGERGIIRQVSMVGHWSSVQGALGARGDLCLCTVDRYSPPSISHWLQTTSQRDVVPLNFRPAKQGVTWALENGKDTGPGPDIICYRPKRTPLNDNSFLVISSIYGAPVVYLASH